jgi:hypothetical protein
MTRHRIPNQPHAFILLPIQLFHYQYLRHSTMVLSVIFMTNRQNRKIPPLMDTIQTRNDNGMFGQKASAKKNMLGSRRRKNAETLRKPRAPSSGKTYQAAYSAPHAAHTLAPWLISDLQKGHSIGSMFSIYGSLFLSHPGVRGVQQSLSNDMKNSSPSVA